MNSETRTDSERAESREASMNKREKGIMAFDSCWDLDMRMHLLELEPSEIVNLYPWLKLVKPVQNCNETLDDP